MQNESSDEDCSLISKNIPTFKIYLKQAYAEKGVMVSSSNHPQFICFPECIFYTLTETKLFYVYISLCSFILPCLR